MMSKASHTPGPWGFDRETGEVFYDDGDVRPMIAGVLHDGETVSFEQACADMALIAAAPEMLARLKSERENRDNILRFLLDGHTEMVIEMLQNGGKATDDVIAKATGEVS